MMIKLSPRLHSIANCIQGAVSMADIGTDHGYLPVYLMENALVAHAIASDVNQKPLEKAAKTIAEQSVKNIETRLGSGLSVLVPGEVEVIVMAGMGGLLIRDLIQAQPEVARGSRLVLQPMRSQAILRRFLETSGFKIVKEELAIEGNRVYEIMVVTCGAMAFKNPMEYELGFEFEVHKHPCLEALIDRKIALEEDIVLHTEGKETPTATRQCRDSRAFIEKLKAVKQRL